MLSVGAYIRISSVPFCTRAVRFFSAQVEAPLGFGEEVRLSGNVPALGNSDPNRAIPLYTTQYDYPKWTTKAGKLRPTKHSVCVRCASHRS